MTNTMKAAAFVEPGRIVIDDPAARLRATKHPPFSMWTMPVLQMAVFAPGPIGRDLSPWVTPRFGLDDIETADELFGNQRDGVLEVATAP